MQSLILGKGTKWHGAKEIGSVVKYCDVFLHQKLCVLSGYLGKAGNHYLTAVAFLL